MTYEQAASTQTTFATAWHCLVTRAHVRAGETVLDLGRRLRRGLVGHPGRQARRGARHHQRRQRAEARAGAGAGRRRRRSTTRRRTSPRACARRPTAAASTSSWSTSAARVFERSLAAVAVGGRVVVCGGHAGEVVDLDLIELFRHEWSVIGCARATEAELRHVIELVGRGELTPVVSEALRPRRRGRAHRLMEDRRQFGKLILIAHDLDSRSTSVRTKRINVQH